MKALQIATGFDFSSLYKNLFKEMVDQNIDIEVNVPRKKIDDSPEINTSEFNYKMIISKEITRLDQLLYFPRIKKVAKQIEKSHDVNTFDVMHAHSLLSDGGIAYELYKKHKIPYIVAVRDTDINKYFKFAKHLKPQAFNILKHAQNVVFLSKSYKDLMYEKYFPQASDDLIEKSVVIPNGIDNFWHSNRQNVDKHFEDSDINLIFVGKLTERKNPYMVIEVNRLLQEMGYKSTVQFVGSGDLESNLKDAVKDDDSIQLLGQLNDKKELWYLYKNKDALVVPSFTETFGLVYAEALSTGTPVIYTRNQGFDGIYEEGEVGYSVDPNDAKEIVGAILKIKDNRDRMSKNALEASKAFNWEDIVNQYSDLYEKSRN